MAATSKPMDALVHQALGYYVYALCNPLESNAIFYVGRGVGDRVLMHEWESLKPGSTEPKHEVIQRIYREGQKVHTLILRRGLTLAQAIEIEAALIDTLRYIKEPLKNLAAGAGTERGLRSLDGLVADFSAKPLVVDRIAVVVRINKSWFEGISSGDLWDMSRSWWDCQPEQHKPRLLLAVAQKIVRGAWDLNPNSLGAKETPSWEHLGAIKRKVFYADKEEQFVPFTRWSFAGDGCPSVDADKFLGRKFELGGQNPIAYLKPSSQPSK